MAEKFRPKIDDTVEALVRVEAAHQGLYKSAYVNAALARQARRDALARGFPPTTDEALLVAREELVDHLDGDLPVMSQDATTIMARLLALEIAERGIDQQRLRPYCDEDEDDPVSDRSPAS